MKQGADRQLPYCTGGEIERIFERSGSKDMLVLAFEIGEGWTVCTLSRKRAGYLEG